MQNQIHDKLRKKSHIIFLTIKYKFLKQLNIKLHKQKTVCLYSMDGQTEPIPSSL